MADANEHRLDALERKLEEIESVLGIRPTTSSSVIDEIRSQLARIERDAKKSTWTAIAAFAGSYVLAGLGLTLTAAANLKAHQFGWGLVVIGVLAALWCWFRWSRT